MNVPVKDVDSLIREIRVTERSDSRSGLDQKAGITRQRDLLLRENDTNG